MNSIFSSNLHFKDNNRKSVVAKPTRYDQIYGSSLQIISEQTFLANVKTSGFPSLHVASSPEFDAQVGSSLQIIRRKAYEATVKKVPKRSKSSIDGSSWERSVCLGEGAHGIVHLATRNGSEEDDSLPEKMAIKSAPISYSDCLNDEERILKSLSSPYVVACYGSNITWSATRPRGSDFNLILEYCSGGSIADYMRFRGTKIAERDVQLFALDILRGINYIHSQKIIHCDLKPANILLKPQVDRVMPNGLEPKICDFGLALRKTSDEYGDGCGLTRESLLYMTPELLYCDNLDYCADIWSFGCTILEMLTGKKPWSELGIMERMKLKDVIGISDVTPEIPTWLSNDAKDFLAKCLQKDPAKKV